MSKKNYKILAVSLVLAVVVSAFMLTTTGFADSREIKGFAHDRISPTTLADTYAELGESDIFGSEDSLIVSPGQEIRIPLTADMFEWSNGRNPLKMETVRTHELRRSVAVRTLVQSGAKTLDYVQIDTDTFEGATFYHSGDATKTTERTAYISIMFTNQLISTEDQDFCFDIYLTAGGKRNKNYEIRLQGTMVMDTLDVYNGMDYADIGDGTVVVAEEFVRGLNLNLGNGATIKATLNNEQKALGVSKFKNSTALDPLEYPAIYDSIYGIYQLKTKNLSSGANRVRLNPPKDDEHPEIDSYFVYGQDMTLLGKTKEWIAYSDTYILTTRELTSMESGSYLEEYDNLPVQEQGHLDKLAGDKLVLPVTSDSENQ